MSEHLSRYTYVHHPYYSNANVPTGGFVVAVDMSVVLAHIAQLEQTMGRIVKTMDTLRVDIDDLHKDVSGLEKTLKNEVFGKLPKPVQAQRCPECEVVRSYDKFPEGDFLCQECRGVIIPE